MEENCRKNSLLAIQNKIHELLRGHGFSRKSKSWYRESEDVIRVFGIQVSGYTNDVFYLNIGIYAKSLGKLKRPKDYQCHLWIRLSELLPEEKRSELEALCDFTSGSRLSDVERAEAICDFLGEYAVPVLVELADIKAVSSWIKTKGKRATVQLPLREFLEAQFGG